MKFVSVWKDIRVERGEDIIEAKEEVDDPGGIIDAVGVEREISQS
jgi:hypothetical protein